MRTERTYHPNLFLLAINNLLPKTYSNIIPKSTIGTWKKNPHGTSYIIGMDSNIADQDFIPALDQMIHNKFVFKSVRTITKIIKTYSNIINTIDSKKKILIEHKETIVNCIQSVKENIGIKRALKVFNISKHQYYSWKYSLIKCSSSIINLCKRKYYHQLLNREIQTLTNYFSNDKYKFWDTSSIYFQMIKDKAVYFSISTCYKYVRMLNLKAPKIPHRRKNHLVGLRATRLFEILHMDISIFKCADNSKIYIYLICDNYSRKALGYKLSKTFDVSLVTENLKEVILKYELTTTHSRLIADNGVENNTIKLNEFIDTSPAIEKQIAQLTITQSNSMVENYFKQLKYQHIFPKEIANQDAGLKLIPEMINDQDNRPRGVLNGLTPNEVVNGLNPKNQVHKPEIVNARRNRMLENKNTNCNIQP